jgi:hypothetical protein
VSGRAVDVAHLKRISSHPLKLTLSLRGSACAGIEPGTSRTHGLGFALAHSMNMHGRAAAMVTPIGDKRRLFPAESAMSSSGCAGQGRVKRAARERRKGSTRGCRERSDAKVCVSASVAEGPSATLNTSRGVHLGISAHLEMGRRPMHVYTLTLKCTPRGTPSLSLDQM